MHSRLDALREQLQTGDAAEAGFSLAHLACAKNTPPPILMAARNSEPGSEALTTTSLGAMLHVSKHSGVQGVESVPGRHVRGQTEEAIW